MTIILTVGNDDQVALFADRRLSVRGVPTDDEASKAGFLMLPRARLAFGMTGLARRATLTGATFDTMRWLNRRSFRGTS